MSYNPDGCVALCFTSVASSWQQWTCTAERNSGQTSVSVEADQDVRDMCLSWVRALVRLRLHTRKVVCDPSGRSVVGSKCCSC